MVKKYKARNWDLSLIEEVEVILETEKFITVKSESFKGREAKVSATHFYCDTLEEAKDWVEKYYRAELERKKVELDKARNKLSEVLKRIGR